MIKLSSSAVGYWRLQQWIEYINEIEYCILYHDKKKYERIDRKGYNNERQERREKKKRGGGGQKLEFEGEGGGETSSIRHVYL